MTSLPFLWLSLSFSAGVLLKSFYSPALAWSFLLTDLLVLFFLRGRKMFSIFLCVGFCLLGILFGNLDYFPAKSRLEGKLDAGGFQSSALFSGRVVTEPQLKQTGRKETLSFVFECKRYRLREAGQTGRWQESEAKLQVFLNQPGRIPEIGEDIKIWGHLEGLPPLLNPGGFDYARYLQLQGISGILNAYGAKSVTVIRPAAPFSFPSILAAVRRGIRGSLERYFQSEDALVVKALILGDRKNFKGKLLDDFLKTGTSHLLAISGLNISLVAGSLYLILIVLRVGQKKAAAAALVTAGIQVAVAGFGIPVQRAGIMAGLAFGAIILERERSGLNIFFLAFLLIAAADTRTLESISFQLTFLSLFCLILFSYYWNRKWPWSEAWAASAAVLAGTFPVVVFHFSTFSPIGILVNILGIPLFHLILLTAFFSLLLGALPVAGPAVIWICKRFISLGLGWIHFCAQADWGYYFIPKPGWGLTAFYYAALASSVLSFKIKHRLRWAAFAASFSLWLVSAGAIWGSGRNDHFSMTVFSAGANEIAHLQFGRDNHWLINAGRTLPGDQAQWILSPFLRRQGVKNLKGVIFTDGLKRHQSGIETLERDFNFEYKVYPQPPKREAVSGEDGRKYLGRGGKILMPTGEKIEVLESKRGELTLLIDSRGKRILFLPRANYRVFQRLAQLENHKINTLVLFSSRGEPGGTLKSILTLTKPDSVVLPKLKKEWADIFEGRQLELIDLSQQGAFQLRAIPLKNGDLSWQAQTFLKQGAVKS